MEHRGWPPAPAGSTPSTKADQSQAQAPRPGAGFGSGTPQHQTQHSSPSGPSGLPPPPPGSAFSFHQPHGLASLAGISQSSPRQPAPLTHRPEVPQAQAPQGPGFPLPGLSQATGQVNAAERERERAREVEQIHIKEEEDRRHRELDRQRLEHTVPHQPQSGPPMHLHQPIAVGPRTVHGPNGLLGNAGLGSLPPQMPLGAPSGPGNIFAGGPVQPAAQAQGPTSQQMQPGLLMPFGPTGQPQAPQPPAQGQGQGQQPILNDALSYLDQVKVQFADHPDVYNRFLDIMKDFKSGAIDTPGVIGRVSTLFAGNPELIQGFNTFLPPGYRIECGTGDDPNAIRVTTPMGTTVQSMPQPRPLSRQEGPERPSNGTFTPQPVQSAQMMFSPSGRPIGPAAPGPPPPQHLMSLEAARQQEQQAIHQQEQRGVNSLQNAVSAATSGGLRVGVSPRATPMPGQDPTAVGVDVQAQAAMEKRGPVEFNHAISYVNKIKNRFSSHPDIYKQFLEILQTYQRESKPIQDVYSQVTHLFKTAPDLLEDFKQFLPESAAQAKAAERARKEAEESAMLSNVRGEGMYGSPVMSRETHMGTPSHGRGLPPVGNFAPTPVSKDNKRKRTDRQATVVSAVEPTASIGKTPITGQLGKRVKQSHATGKDVINQPPQSPSLVPALPTPLAPTTTSAATSDELAFFDRAKKAISNKNTMNEFLKLCNLFSQDLIDRSVLIYRARSFIGGNPDLMKYFEEFVGYDERDVVIENKARIPSGRVSLSNCRGLGPSYRLLPKRERQKPCSGRDELCNSVLNDEWASHPTWASEDSGFIAHRKNVHEEGLHRIEEERHDYDYNIEACNRTIQLLEPIAQQLRRLSDVEQQGYKLPPGLGGQSETIYKRVIMKLYGRDKGHEVITQLHDQPYRVIPVLLNRLKERLETWKMAQREWEKVWREQTQKMFWRSLDHQAVNASRNDKRQFQTKTLVNEIQVKHEEMRRLENNLRGTMRNAQMEIHIKDQEVLVDATCLVLAHVDSQAATDQPRLHPFITEFVPLFFGLDPEEFNAQLKVKLGEMSPNEAIDEALSGAEDSGATKLRKSNGKPGNLLLRQAVDRGRNGKTGRKDRDESNASASRATTPDMTSVLDDDMALDVLEDGEAKAEQPTQRWFDHPADNNLLGGAHNVDPNEPQKRDTFILWANSPIYCFIRMFVILYERLNRLKLAEDSARATIQSGKWSKPAVELGISDKLPQDLFADTSKEANYYNQMLDKFQEVLRDELEFTVVEETLRRYYLQTGYPLYAFEKMVAAIAKFAGQILNGEGKDKSWDIWQMFRKDRARDATTKIQQIDYRKNVEKNLKESELYRIDYGQSAQRIRIYLTKKDDPAYLDDGLSSTDRENRWRSYIASFQTVDFTDGVDQAKMSFPLLYRNMRAIGADPKSTSYPPSPPAAIASDSHETAANAGGDRLVNRFLAAKSDENLVMRVSVGEYKAMFQPTTHEGWSLPMSERDGGRDGVDAAAEDFQYRQDTMKEMFETKNEGTKNMTTDEVERSSETFKKLVDGDDAAGGNVEGAGGAMEVDQ